MNRANLMNSTANGCATMPPDYAPQAPAAETNSFLPVISLFVRL